MGDLLLTFALVGILFGLMIIKFCTALAERYFSPQLFCHCVAYLNVRAQSRASHQTFRWCISPHSPRGLFTPNA